MAFNPNRPYNELPPLPPKVEVETKDVLKKTITAGRALAELKGLGETIPDQSMLVNTIVLQEAQASSEIENIVTTNDALYRAITTDSANIDPMTKEVLRYREALWMGYKKLSNKPFLNTNLFTEIVQTIKQNDAGIRNLPGTTIANQRTGKAIYTPPEGENIIRNKLKDLEDFIHTDDTFDPLVKMALVHYQFEAIHPFFDGNGRTGRIINILYLIMQGLLEIPVLYSSKRIIDRKSHYYRLLKEVTEKNAWEQWILFMLDVVESTAILTARRINNIRILLDKILTTARKKLPSRVYSKELIELIFRQPYTKTKFLVDVGLAERKTAAEYLKELEKIGILESKKIGRENLYLNKNLYKVLSE